MRKDFHMIGSLGRFVKVAMITIVLPVIISAFFFQSCGSKPGDGMKIDTTSCGPDTSYMSLVKEITSYNRIHSKFWQDKIQGAGDLGFSFDSTSTFEISEDWNINDSVHAFVIQNSDNLVCTHDYLFTFRNKVELVNIAEIGYACDSDGYPYKYTDYVLTKEKRKIEVTEHCITSPEGSNEEKDSIENVLNLSVAHDGVILIIVSSHGH